MQSEFRVGLSCTTALLQVTDDIHAYMDENKLTALVLLDHTKLFDKIKHSLLIGISH